METPRYKWLEELAKGGMATVFKGLDLDNGNLVAIKVMKAPKNAEEERVMRQNFTREMDIALRVDHPHVLRAIGHGETVEEGSLVPFLVYPYIEDGNLLSCMKKTRPWQYWDLPQMVDVIEQAAQGLYFVHSLNAGVTHRDVKPENFLYRRVQGQGPQRRIHVWLSDFGIARQHISPDYQTISVMGTPGYAAPEQLSGYIQPSADQFSLAVVARYFLTGYPPGHPAGTDWLRAPLSRLNPERFWSPEIDLVMQKALAEKPDQRYPTILDFAQALREAVVKQFNPRFYEAITEPLRPIPATETQRLKPRAAELIFPEIANKRAPADPQPVQEPPPVEDSYERERIVAPLLPPFPLTEMFRNELPAKPTALTWSPDGEALLCTFFSQAPLLIHRSGKMEAIQALASSHLVCWSPDAALVAGSASSGRMRQEVRIWKSNEPLDLPLTLFSAEGKAINGLDWSCRGQLALWVDQQILLYTLPEHIPAQLTSLVPQLLTTPNASCGDIGTLRWSPDGLLLAAGAHNGTLSCWRVDSKQVFWHIPASGQRVCSLAWSADSATLVIAFMDRRVEIWNVYEKRKLAAWDKLWRTPRALSLSAQQGILAVATAQELLFGRLDEAGPTAKYTGQLLAAWSPAGPELAALDGQNKTQLVLLSS